MKKWPKCSYFALKNNFQDMFFSEKTDLAFPPSKREWALSENPKLEFLIFLVTTMAQKITNII